MPSGKQSQETDGKDPPCYSWVNQRTIAGPWLPLQTVKVWVLADKALVLLVGRLRETLQGASLLGGRRRHPNSIRAAATPETRI